MGGGWRPWDDPHHCVVTHSPLLGTDGAGTRDLNSTSVSPSERDAEEETKCSPLATASLSSGRTLMVDEAMDWLIFRRQVKNWVV